MPQYPFIPAHWTFKGRHGKRPIWVVLHTAESPEGPQVAEAIAVWGSRTPAQGGPPTPASWHYVVDRNSIVQSVHETDRAAGAPGANEQGIHIELAGHANQTAEQWADDASQATLEMAAPLVADICKRRGIPVGVRVAEELKKGMPGITGHMFCTQAFGGTHTDPGVHFPWGRFMVLVRAAQV